MDFTHFIITQFNLRNFPLSGNNDYEKWLEWTRKRIMIFRQYCLPSVINQSSQGFRWLLFFDESTPAEFNIFVNELRSCPFIDICYSKGFEGFRKDYMNEVRKRSDGSSKWLITTRIDNDDCLHKDAVRTIQENFTEKHKYLISLSSGYILNLDDNTLSHYYYPMSPFLSLIENTELQTGGVFEKGHTAWNDLKMKILKEIFIEYFKKEARTSRFILKKPLWIQLFHGNNVSNSFWRGLPVTRSLQLQDFSINFPSRPQSPLNITKYINYVTWKRYFKSVVVKTLIKK